MKQLTLIALFFLMLFHFAVAQDNADSSAENPTQSAQIDDSGDNDEVISRGDFDLNPAILNLQLNPLTASELEEKAKAWQAALKTAATDVSEAAIKYAEAADGSSDKKAALATLTEAKKVEADLLEKFEVVLDEWEQKGGDPEQMRTYASALKAPVVNPTDTFALFDALARWFRADDGAILWLKKIAIFISILIVSWIVAGMVKKVVMKALKKHNKTSDLVNRFVEKIIKRVVLVIGLLVAISTLGVEIGPMLALLGGGAFILGFALQDSLSNFANGMMLLVYRPFDVGDAVEVGGVSGSVDSVSLVNTTIRTWDNKVVLVPNKNVWGQTITNINAAGERRVDMVFGISYEDDMDKALSILEKIVSETEGVLEEPETNIKVNELADSSVNFICRPWAKSTDYWAVYWTITKRVKEEFDKAGISIPYPQQDVHLHTVKEDEAGQDKQASGEAAS